MKLLVALLFFLIATTPKAHALFGIAFTPKIKARVMIREAKLCSRLFTDSGAELFVPDGLPAPHKMTPEEVAVWADALTDRGSRYGEFMAQAKDALRLAAAWDKRMRAAWKKVEAKFEQYAHEWVPASALRHAESGILDLEGRITGLSFSSTKSFASFVAAGGARDFARMGYNHLRIKALEMKWQDVGDLSQWSTLAHLELINPDVRPVAGESDPLEAQQAVSNPSLVSLKTLSMAIGSKTAHLIGDHPNLKDVDLQASYLGNVAFAKILESRSIERLEVRLGSIDDAAFGKLPANSRLTFLDLSDNIVGPEFIEWLTRKSSIVELELNHTEFGEALAIQLGQALQSLPHVSLRKLMLWNNNYIGDYGLRTLYFKTPLTHLGLTSERITFKGLEWLLSEPETNISHLNSHLFKKLPRLKERFQEW